MSAGITFDEWRKAIDEAGLTRKAIAGMSTKEIAAGTGLSLRTARLKIREWHDLGWLKFAGTRPEPSIDGKMARVPVYVLVMPAKGKARR